MTNVNTLTPLITPLAQPMRAANPSPDRVIEPLSRSGASREQQIDFYDPPRAILRLLDSTREAFRDLEARLPQPERDTSEPVENADSLELSEAGTNSDEQAHPLDGSTETKGYPDTKGSLNSMGLPDTDGKTRLGRPVNILA